MLIPIEKRFNEVKEEFEKSAEVLKQLISQGIITEETHPEIFQAIEKNKEDLPTREVITWNLMDETAAEESKRQVEEQWKMEAESTVSEIPTDKAGKERFIKDQFNKYMRSSRDLVIADEVLDQAYMKAFVPTKDGIPIFNSPLFGDLFHGPVSPEELSIEPGSALADAFIKAFKLMFGENYVLKRERSDITEIEEIAKRDRTKVITLPNLVYNEVAGLQGSDGQEILSAESLIEKEAEKFDELEFEELLLLEKERLNEMISSFNSLGEGSIRVKVYDFPRGYTGIRVAGYPDSKEPGVIHIARYLLANYSTLLPKFMGLASVSVLKSNKNEKNKGQVTNASREDDIIRLQQAGRAQVGTNNILRDEPETINLQQAGRAQQSTPPELTAEEIKAIQQAGRAQQSTPSVLTTEQIISLQQVARTRQGIRSSIYPQAILEILVKSGYVSKDIEGIHLPKDSISQDGEEQSNHDSGEIEGQ